MSARTRFLAGPVRGRTHRSAPTRGSIREPTEICAGNGPCPNGAGCAWGGGGVWSPRPTGASQVVCGNGPIWASAPTKRSASRINLPSQRRAAKRPRQRSRGASENRRRDHQKGAVPPQPPKQRLAKRKARKEQLVKFGLCPTTLECSTAYQVRRFQQDPARAPVGAASTEQNSLGPHPAARQGAPRP